MKIHFCVNKTILKRTSDEILASYSKNIDKCVFKCDDCWSDIYKYALFTGVSNEQYIEDLGFGHKVSCIIPDEIMKGNYFSVSVFGGDRKTTIQEHILIEPSGFTDKTETSFESDETEILPSSSFDTDYHRRIGCQCNNLRWNLFEIEEHPYYY